MESEDGATGDGTTATGFRVDGRVQGVGYRFWTVEVARELGLTGWVRNEPDGSVAMQVRGATLAVAELERRLARGPAPASVSRVVRLPASGDLPRSGFGVR